MTARKTTSAPRWMANWVGEITRACARGTVDTLALARLVAKARGSLEYGKWSQMWNSGLLPFSKRKADMLALIGQELGELVEQDSAQLPSGWNILYYVARLGSSLVKRLVKKGTIHSNLGLTRAKELLAKYKPEATKRRVPSKAKFQMIRFTRFMRTTGENWSKNERQFAVTQVLPLLKTFCRAPG